MSATHGSRRRGGGHGGGHDEGMERWLLTYADMITLLLALFIVLWSISSVNISKFSALKASLKQALSGKVISGSSSILSGGPSPLDPQGTQVPQVQPTVGNANIPNVQASLRQQIVTAFVSQDIENLAHLKQQIDSYAKAREAPRPDQDRSTSGAVIHVLTDQSCSSSRQATLEPQSRPPSPTSRIYDVEWRSNLIRVEGNTDDRPIKTLQFPELSSRQPARAPVLRFLVDRGVPEQRLSLAGYADQRPIATNSTAAGRSANRRVDVVVLRRS
jgi:chemotaxis protein MotB